MADVEVRVEGIDGVLRRLGRLGPKVFRPAVADAAAHLKSVIATYPPRRFGAQPPKTMKQRVFLVWAIGEGVIDYPYRRGLSPGSAGLGRRWTVEFRDGGRTAIVGNNAPYARYVHGAEDQSEFHKTTGWKTDRQVAEQEAGTVYDILLSHIRQATRR